ncbi:L-aspartate oxidase [Coralliovum pocilloporae]|uniref:L-aspartate oxidase n=1 Tax=Coralliovum pocilloporae TaxID=3066369 RepID=UPI0033076DF7
MSDNRASASTTDDVVIVGAGLAGLFCALCLAPRPVTVLAAAPIGRGASSAWAQAGIAASVTEGDTVAAHVADTIAAGAGLVDRNIAQLMASEARDRVHDLLSYGVPFDTDLEGRLKAHKEAAHSFHRVVGVRGDTAGKAIMAALIEQVRQTPSIRLMEGVVAEELYRNGRAVTGVFGRPNEGSATRTLFLPTRAVVLATGGIGHLYETTTNPAEAQGSGLALAARAGAVIADAEFVQFHPTAIVSERDPSPLATEALRGEGAWLVDRDGHRFMPDCHELAELAPRDIVARAIHQQNTSGQGAYLDTRDAVGASFPERFPSVHAMCLDAGIDPVKEPIPVAPAAHYHMGGVLTDASARTSLDGLWAIGEAASTGAHGANRLASNSLLEAVVFAGRAARDIRDLLPYPQTYESGEADEQPGFVSEAPDVDAVKALRQIMSRHVGVVRNRDGLLDALSAIDRLTAENFNDRFRNMALAARIVTGSALLRTESRGGHYRSDCTETDPAQARRSYWTLASLDRTIRQTIDRDTKDRTTS